MLRHVRKATYGEEHNWHLKCYDYALFWGEESICVDALDPNETFTQDHFRRFEPSDLKKHTRNLRRRRHPIELAGHMDNSPFHNG
jgi:hypothetical protein